MTLQTDNLRQEKFRTNGLLTDSYVSLLVNDELGRELVSVSDELLPDQWKLKPNNRCRYEKNFSIQEGEPFGYATAVTLAAINTALDKLGIKNIRTASIEDILGLIRMSNHPLYTAWGPFGLAVQPRLCEYGKRFNHDVRMAELLMHQTGIKDHSFIIEGPRLSIDPRFPLGVKFVYTEDSVVTPAPEVDAGNFFTTPYQPALRLFKEGRKKRGPLEVDITIELSNYGIGELAKYHFEQSERKDVLRCDFDDLYWVRGLYNRIFLSTD